eukprot:TRINITY_DN27188_c0_g1_i1.p1 TRINITY_DN27188_c0_g1~~TRINITY_DN27188_c0_g1_i1.p1  ORF type:complete len:363 (+),score=110.68 TRINITY_DN27188_c0_g1_i1:67-1155(+)
MTTDRAELENRFDPATTKALIEASWPQHEVQQYNQGPNAGLLLLHNNPLPHLPYEPSDKLQFAPLKRTRFAIPCPEGVSREVMRMYRKSQVRVPLLWHSTEVVSTSWHKMSDTDGEPFDSISKLAGHLGIEMEHFRLGAAAEDVKVKCFEKLRECLDEGKWFLLVEKSTPSHELYREIGRTLLTLEPDALKYPKREQFRLWVKVETDPAVSIDLNQNVGPYFPRIFTQNCLMSVKVKDPTKGHTRKIVRALLTDPFGHPEYNTDVYSQQVHKRLVRHEKGREDDSESDDDWNDNPECPTNLDGARFARVRELALSSALYGEKFVPSFDPRPDEMPYFAKEKDSIANGSKADETSPKAQHQLQ